MDAPTFEIRDADGRSVSVGDVISGDFTIWHGDGVHGYIAIRGAHRVDSLPPAFALSPAPSPVEVVTVDAGKAGAARWTSKGAYRVLDPGEWRVMPGGEWKVTS